MITKTDYRLFLEAPLHLWASKNDKTESGPSLYDQHLMKQGREVEALAQIFAEEFIQQGADAEVEFQQTYCDGEFQARVDILVRSINGNTVDIYEVKSETSIKKVDKYDVTFQRLVCEANENMGSIYLVHLNKEYVREGPVDLEQLFVVENMDEVTELLRDEVMEGREAARQAATAEGPTDILSCLKPDRCPCPSLCHADLPEHPVFDVPRLYGNKVRQLLDSGIRSVHDIPANFPLSDNQQQHVEVIQAGAPRILHGQIAREFQSLEYPLSFLDYETYGSAVPIFDGYEPYKPIVFQHSLHVLDGPDSEPQHFECLLTDNEDPGPALLEHLAQRLPETGSVIVWYKPFEVTRNKEMAERYPEYREFIGNMNARVYDLMEIFSKGLYIHPDFHGSASIKKVLPVLVPDLDQGYTGLQISNGEEAMLAWIEIISDEIPRDDIEQVQNDLLAYCKLDTLAMIRIYQEVCDELT